MFATGKVWSLREQLLFLNGCLGTGFLYLFIKESSRSWSRTQDADHISDTKWQKLVHE